jgi:hypothetical protein
LITAAIIWVVGLSRVALFFFIEVGQSVSRTDDLKPMPAKSKIKGNVSKKKAPVDD